MAKEGPVSDATASPTPGEAGREGAGPQGWVLYGIIAAIVVGALLGGLAPGVGVRLALLGELFMSALKMIVVPLVITSMICGVTALGDVRKLGTLGTRTFAYYMATTGAAVVLGIVLVNVIRPGAGVARSDEFPDAGYTIAGDAITLSGAELPARTYEQRYRVVLQDQGIEGHIAAHERGSPTLRVSAWTPYPEPIAAEGEEPPAVTPAATGRGISLELFASAKTLAARKSPGEAMADILRKLVPSNLFQAMANMDVLPLIVFSLVFGAVLTTLGEAGKPAVDLFVSLNEGVMGVVHVILYTAPIGIFGLVAARIGNAGGFAGFGPELKALAWYFGTVVLGLAIHGCVTLVLILRMVGRRGVLSYVKGVAPALLNAFSTASSSATLPVTTECVEERNGVSDRIAGFVLPLGATVNMDGTALYEAVAAIFIAQVFGVELSTLSMIVIFLTATLASIGAAGIPEAGLVTMVMVLTAVQLPLEGMTLILTVDWLLDRFRTTINVWGDAVGAATIEALENRDREPAAAAG
jgi:Na+/H+-dicarboxylate symporter